MVTASHPVKLATAGNHGSHSDARPTLSLVDLTKTDPFHSTVPNTGRNQYLNGETKKHTKNKKTTTATNI